MEEFLKKKKVLPEFPAASVEKLFKDHWANMLNPVLRMRGKGSDEEIIPVLKWVIDLHRFDPKIMYKIGWLCILCEYFYFKIFCEYCADLPVITKLINDVKYQRPDLVEYTASFNCVPVLKLENSRGEAASIIRAQWLSVWEKNNKVVLSPEMLARLFQYEIHAWIWESVRNLLRRHDFSAYEKMNIDNLLKKPQYEAIYQSGNVWIREVLFLHFPKSKHTTDFFPPFISFDFIRRNFVYFPSNLQQTLKGLLLLCQRYKRQIAPDIRKKLLVQVVKDFIDQK